MGEPRQTEERLKTWVIDQSAQERLCLAILSLDARFFEVKPRRPKGGPDGARDIEAVFQNGEEVWGAVGFRKNVTDDSNDKRWVKKKFKKDVDAAKKKNPSLPGFVFFTNVDLTPEDGSELKKYALDKGLSFVELYWRERLRVALDSSRGLGFRFTYLSIPLSEAEQSAFFAEYGQALERLMQEGFSAMDQKFHRLEFLHECKNQLVNAGVVVRLLRPLNAEELGHYRFFAKITDTLEKDNPNPTLWIGGRDSFWEFNDDDPPVRVVATQSLAWYRNPDETLHTSIAIGDLTTEHLQGWVDLVGHSPFSTLSELDRKIVVFWVSKPLLPCIESIFLIVNNYQLAGGHREEFWDHPEYGIGPAPEWPEKLTDEEAKIPWAFVLYPQYLDFSDSTPPKLH